MISTNFGSDAKVSLCLTEVDSRTDKINCYRIADYYPDNDPHELVPALLRADAMNEEESRNYPDFLRNPKVSYNYDDRTSDFTYLQWVHDPYNSWEIEYPTESEFDNASLNLEEPIEVIFLEESGGEIALRKALQIGIPYIGKLTKKFCIAYNRIDGEYEAILCNRIDFSLQNGLIKLPATIANVRNSLLSAPKVMIQSYNIIESRHGWRTGRRSVYDKLSTPETIGSVVLRPIEHYAADYIKWFCDLRHIPLSRPDRQEISKIIETAMAFPDGLESYLGGKAPENECLALKRAIDETIHSSESITSQFIQALLVENASFKQECLERAQDHLGSEIEAIQNDIHDSEATLANLKAAIDGEQSLLATKKNERKEIEDEIEALTNNLIRINPAATNSAMESASNASSEAALRSGAIGQQGLPVAQKSLHSPSRSIECELRNLKLHEVLAKNLAKLGVTSIYTSSPADERAIIALATESSLSHTKLLCCHQPLATAFADALSASVAGRTADRFWIPADFRNAAELISSINSTKSGVVIVDNVIDPVNEGLLNAITFAETKPIIVFPFTSRASLRLLAPEIWASVFFIPSEQLDWVRTNSQPSSLFSMTSKPSLPQHSTSSLTNSASQLLRDLNNPPIPGNSILLAASVMLSSEKIDNDYESPERLISQHLALASAASPDVIDSLCNWSPEDDGLNILKELLAND